MPVAVKICGLTRPEDVAAAVDSGADFVGAILVGHSKRAVAPAALRHLFAAAGGRVRRVAVTVDADDALLDAIAGEVDLIQLHGGESPERVRAVRSRTGLGVVKVLPVAVAADLAPLPAYRGLADLFLFDAKPPPGGIEGGNGLAFDWQLVAGIDAGETAWGLAGGLDPTNVATAVTVTRPGFVDVASGVETTPGIKDHAKIRAFVAAARRGGQREGTT
jgi:phosphoribosylanthranilate isomerase